VNELQRQLDARRRKLRLSYPQLARLTGIPQSTVWNLINGPMVQPPSKEKVEQLAKALDWPVDHLMQLVGEQFGYHVYTVEDEGLQVLMASWSQMSPRDRESVLALAQVLIRNRNNNDRP